MFTEKMITRSLRWAMSGLLGATVSTFALADTAAVISNMATGEYKEEGSTVVQTSRSNLVRTTIIPTYSFTLTSNNEIDAALNQTVYFNHVLTNTANAEDTFTLSAVTNNGAVALSQIVVYLDKDRNGVPDSDQPVTQYSLNAGEAVALIVKAVVGATGAVGAGGSLKITATSAQSGVAAQSNTDTVKITDKAVLSIRKSFNKDIVVKDDEAIVRLTYQNMGTESGEVHITDVLNSAELLYVSGADLWNGQVLNSASGSNDPTGINYYWDEATKTVSARITSVPANAQGYIEFKVKVVKGTPGQIPNFADMTFDHDKNTVTPVLTAKSNTAILEIKPVYSYGVVINADASTASNVNDIDSRGPVATGSTVLFNNWVWNTGNTTDRFNLTMGTHNFPVGTVLEFFREDGVTPLFDTNGDGVADTGYIEAGGKLPVVVKATFPKDYIDTANTQFEVKPVAQSIADSSKTDDVTDRVTLSQNDLSRTVDLTNQPEDNGVGNGAVSNGAAAWKNLSGDNTKKVIFPLQVSHVGLATSYQFSADDDGVFSTLKLPAGVSGVRYYGTADNCQTVLGEISSTRVLNNGETQTYCAVVSLDATAATGTVDIYFRVASSELPAPNAQNAYDTIHNSISITSKNSQGGITLDPDLRGQIAPGGTITYTHILKPWGEQVLKATDTLTVTNDQQGFITTLYFDKNDNGMLDAEDVLMTDLSAVPSATLTDKKPVRIFAKVENSSLGTVGITNTSVISLSDGSTVLDTATDITTITTSPVRLSKLQAKDDDCNGTEEGSFTTGILPITKNANGSGQCVIYQLTVTNMGASDIGRFTFYDATPEAMMMNKSPVCADCDAASITAPAVGQSGEIKGSVPAVKSGASHTLEFGVKYVGN
ncbi:hypothetical protein [Acinetobacter sp. WCHAc010052]|uniref:hypothetical protein n=1 Tax=Acinetobacter sp. WCHAc010052 TaxID=2004647 RepID=UPI000B3C922E|nr:hypothetical protein [Acinetobacter sp. WCHAc010052]AXY60695.1 hypothetical protein CDG61_12095 [Acinetobacter sp. WCHAc010052]